MRPHGLIVLYKPFETEPVTDKRADGFTDPVVPLVLAPVHHRAVGARVGVPRVV